jgi:membrane glycosyltransferase
MIKAPQIWAMRQRRQTPRMTGRNENPGRDVLVLRWLLLILVAATTATAAIRLWSVLRIDGLDTPKILFLSLFVVLFGWISTSFWIACVGAWAKKFGIDGAALIRRSAAEPEDSRKSASRTAIVMPIFNEDVGRVFANLRAMIGSLERTGAIARFDFYILSDTRDPTCRSAEEFAWATLQRESQALDARIYYRHRPKNIGRKSGNIADFCRNWGSLYGYMIVLDADSLMTGETIVSLAGLMDSNSRAALIQVPPQLIGRESLFARLQQFASSVYGPLYSAGLACLQGADGNYWGHNAIIRVAPFMRHCGLPALPGRPPLGGEVLSHDFVEAALLRSAGWELYLAPELGGSYEEPPPTIIDHLKRDRRWCQGNLQHFRLVFAQGFRLPSRLHLLFGVMSYLAAPLWLLMLAASASVAYESNVLLPFTYVGKYPALRWPDSHVFELAMLVLAVSALLFGPKLLALLTLVRDAEMRRAHGGTLRVTLGVVLECIFSALIAPVAMLSHCGFVASVFLGENAPWSSQRRREHRPRFSSVVRTFAPHTLIAIGATLAVQSYLPDSFGWFVPLLLGAALAIPLTIVTSSLRLGRLTRRMGLFLVPSETLGLPLSAAR